MSEDEDNQDLLDEIQALEDALDQKGILNDNEYNSSKCNIGILPEFKTKFENGVSSLIEIDNNNDDDDDENDDSNDDIDDDDADDDGNDDSNANVYQQNVYENYECHNLQDLFELNKKLIESIVSAREKVNVLLEECTSKLRSIDEQISKHTNSWQAKIVSFNAGMPYFKDKNYFTAKRNEDTETKIRNGELRLAELQRIHRWNQIDKNNLLKAIRYEVTLTLLTRSQPDEAYIDNNITKTSQLPNDVREAIGTLGTMKFDWLKIANNISDNKHTAEECEVMWNVFLHPDINKQKWTPKEDRNLNRIVEEYEFEDWDAIAKALNTKRSGYQCFVRYNTNNWKNLMKGQSWTPLDDETLLYLVSKLKIGDYIPWGYIASCMNNWTKQQVYFRWTFSLAPHLKKGRFSEEEDKKLVDAVMKYGLNFSKISALVLPNRTNIQLKEHFQTLSSRQSRPRQVWTIETDSQLLELQKQYGQQWAKISELMPGISRTQARQRYSCLMRYQSRGVPFTSINRNENVDEYILSHTTVTYTTNTPWSRENKEIFVKHLKIDDQLINYFKRDEQRSLKAAQRKRKTYNAHDLKEETKKLYHVLLKLNANLDIPNLDFDDCDLNEINQQLLVSLKSYIEEQKIHSKEDVELIREKMFGPQEVVPEEKRFIPPLPFNFCIPRYKLKKTTGIDYVLKHNELHQMELPMVLEPNKYVTEYLGDDIEYEFEKLKKITIAETTLRKPEKSYSIKCKPFAAFFGDSEECDDEINVIMGSSTRSQQMDYDWELNRMVSDNSSKEKHVVESCPISIIEPSRTTLQAYQELLLMSGNCSTNSKTNLNCRLTSRGRLALDVFKRRYQQLFHVPTGLSRIIPPDVIDESAFLPALEKHKKKNVKRKRPKSIIKVVNKEYVKASK